MATKTHVMALDQGTTSSRAIIFDGDGIPVATAQKELTQFYPGDGMVEHDPEEIWADTLGGAVEAIARAGLNASDIAAIGITNQRETVVVWDRETGKPIHRAIVWQDRRTADTCAALKDTGAEADVVARTGLLLDPYFSATKLAWILDAVDGARAKAEAGQLAFGTIDSWLVYRLTHGKVHVTDATNAARTLLYNIKDQDWDPELCRLFSIPMSLLPEVVDNAGIVGEAAADLLGHAIPIGGMAGDQQAATIGQACFEPGMMKSTYGTGCFALMNVGETPTASTHRMLTTTAYRFDNKSHYALEGAIFIAGAGVQWLRDGIKLIRSADETESLARQAPVDNQVYMVPAFVGLGAPHWDAHARGAIYGMTRVRATLEAVAYQTSDLMTAMIADSGVTPSTVRVDGGMVANDFVCQILADILGVAVDRPRVIETTALGAAYLAGMAVGLHDGLDDIKQSWQVEKRFLPEMDEGLRLRKLYGWHEAVRRTLST